MSADDVLAAVMTERAAAKNISYFAFTATPKAKTLELFGTPGADGLPEPFHLYSMQQAIEERYILDVLTNYLPYKIAWKLAHQGVDYDSDQLVEMATRSRSPPFSGGGMSRVVSGPTRGRASRRR